MDYVIKIAPNGQWTLEKNWKPQDKKTAIKWSDSGLRDHINKLPRASGKLRKKMLADIQSNALKHRINPNTGKREYLMFRAVPENGHKSDFHSKNRTSWPLNPHFAHYWAHLNQTPPKDVVDEEELKGFVPHQVMEAWISEDHVHSYILTI